MPAGARPSGRTAPARRGGADAAVFCPRRPLPASPCRPTAAVRVMSGAAWPPCLWAAIPSTHVLSGDLCPHRRTPGTAGRRFETSEDINVNISYELHLLRRRFPTVTLWFGNATRHFWALVDDRLIEAKTPQELATAIIDT